MPHRALFFLLPLVAGFAPPRAPRARAAAPALRAKNLDSAEARELVRLAEDLPTEGIVRTAPPVRRRRGGGARFVYLELAPEWATARADLFAAAFLALLAEAQEAVREDEHKEEEELKKEKLAARRRRQIAQAAKKGITVRAASFPGGGGSGAQTKGEATRTSSSVAGVKAAATRGGPECSQTTAARLRAPAA